MDVSFHQTPSPTQVAKSKTPLGLPRGRNLWMAPTKRQTRCFKFN